MSPGLRAPIRRGCGGYHCSAGATYWFRPCGTFPQNYVRPSDRELEEGEYEKCMGHPLKHGRAPVLDPTAVPETGVQGNIWNSHFSPLLFILSLPPRFKGDFPQDLLGPSTVFILDQCQPLNSPSFF